MIKFQSSISHQGPDRVIRIPAGMMEMLKEFDKRGPTGQPLKVKVTVESAD